MKLPGEIVASAMRMTGLHRPKARDKHQRRALCSRGMTPVVRVARFGFCLLLAITVLGIATAHAQPVPVGVCDAKADDAPLDFTLSDLNGTSVNLSAYKGHVIVLNFWATWCEPCRVEIPMLSRLHDKYRAKGLTVVGLSLDREIENVPPFARRLGVSYPIFVIGPNHAIDKAYAPRWGVPATVVIRRDGVICRRQVGVPSEDSFEKRLVELLRATNPSH